MPVGCSKSQRSKEEKRMKRTTVLVATLLLVLVFGTSSALASVDIGGSPGISGNPEFCNRDLSTYSYEACLASLATNMGHELKALRKQVAREKGKLARAQRRYKAEVTKNHELVKSVANLEEMLNTAKAKLATAKTQLGNEKVTNTSLRGKLDTAAKTNSGLYSENTQLRIFAGFLILVGFVVGGFFAVKGLGVRKAGMGSGEKPQTERPAWDLNPAPPATETHTNVIRYQGLEISIENKTIVVRGSNPDAVLKVGFACPECPKHGLTAVGAGKWREHIAKSHQELLATPAPAPTTARTLIGVQDTA
ncbi:MAG: hypothetical protein HYW89_01650 [Candidatus Sungiibacteriota bacterium]|uniref:Uncharacterized protein n=1 Tax=Candidatus Sungiibacteriota bacterium TaxID=2750080 RepID=A0A7T5RK23_9BACT|nr:MAG: hypothetical protein HYW89_01650 [Candidatus Sungbacteria bacterium]